MATHRTWVIAALAVFVAACTRGNPTAVATLQPKSGSTVTGTAVFTPKDGAIEIVVEASSLSPGKHGIHVHETGDCSAADGSSAGGHFAPGGGEHGAPGGHAGDLGNLEAGADGSAKLTITTAALRVGAGDRDVIGRALVIHADPDDLTTQPSGNSGARVACGVIAARGG